MGLIIDTSAVVEIERAGMDFPPLRRIQKENVAMPAIVWAELLTGVRMARNARIAARRRAVLEQIRLHFPIIAFTDRIAEEYADIYAECAKAGKMIPQNDMAVAATARAFGDAFLVGPRVEQHFRRVRKLKVVCLSRT